MCAYSFKTVNLLRLIGAVCLLAAFSITGCQPPGQAPQSEAISARPIRILVLEDASLSRKRAGLKRISYSDFVPLIDWLGQSGGEVAYGLITEESNRPFRRLRVDRHLKPVQDTSSNPLLQQQLLREFQQEHQEYQSWEERLADFIGEIIREIRNAVEPDSLSSHTDISGALTRAAIYLCEPPVWEAPARYLIIHSDLEDTIGKNFHGIACEHQILVVNGTGLAPALQDQGIPYKKFESFKAAALYIIEQEKKHQQVTTQPNYYEPDSL